jgi:endonuclease-3
MAQLRTIANRIKRLKEFMDELYPKRHKRRKLAVLDELVLTILSQNTSDVNSTAAFESLKEKFPTWDKVANAKEKDVIKAIRHGGLADQKGPRIQAILKEIYTEHGKYDLSHVSKMPMDEGMEYLLHFKGVGMKTASCVMLFSCGKPAFPVDTHILRVSQRLGIIGVKDNADKATEVYMTHTIPEDRFKFHIDIIIFGREICHPRNPECDRCKLKRICLYFKGELK